MSHMDTVFVAFNILILGVRNLSGIVSPAIAKRYEHLTPHYI